MKRTLIATIVMCCSATGFASADRFTAVGGTLLSKGSRISIVCSATEEAKPETCSSMSFLRVDQDGSYMLSPPIEAGEALDEQSALVATNVRKERYLALTLHGADGQAKIPVTDSAADPINMVSVPATALYIALVYPITAVGDLIRSPYVFITNKMDTKKISTAATQTNIEFLFDGARAGQESKISRSAFKVINYLGFNYDEHRVMERGKLPETR